MWYVRHMTSTTFPVPHTQTKEHRSTTKILASSEPQDKVKMTVDTEGTAHIMSLLTDLYSDPEQAVIREYITNAVDAHADAGQTERPIEATSPTAWEPSFSVKDYGTGMSLDDIKYIYSSYGRSTKRNDFTQVGAFGLGCKSALTLTSQFSLVSVKDGQSVTAVIARGDDGVGTVSITDIRASDEPNGTTVTVPIKDVNKFRNALGVFNLSGFDDGTIVVDNKPNVSFKSNDNAEQYMDGAVTAVPTAGGWYSDTEYFAVMGGVVYPLNRGQIKELATLADLQRQRSVYFEIPIASVDLTPSREALRYTDRTQSLLSSLVTKYMETLVKDARDKMSGCKTLREAIDVFHGFHLDDGLTLSGLAKLGINEWNGSKIPSNFTLAAPKDAAMRKFEVTDEKTTVDKSRNIGLINTYYLFGDSVSVETYRRLFRKYFLNQGETAFSYSLVWLAERPSDDPFFAENVMPQSIDLSVVKEHAADWDKKQRALNGGKAISTVKYDVYTYDPKTQKFSAESVLPSDIPDNALVFKSSQGDYFNTRISIIAPMNRLGLTDFPPVVLLPSNRKFDTLVSRMGRTPMNVSDYLSSAMENLLIKQFGTDWRENYLIQNYEDKRAAQKMARSVDKIEDKELVGLINNVKGENEVTRTILRLLDDVDYSIRSVFTTKHSRVQPDSVLTPYLRANYPLVDTYYGPSLNEDHVDYINAMYLTRDLRSGTLKTKEG